MGVRFDMGSSTLSTLTSRTSGHVEDLGSLVKQLVVAAQPLEGKMNGAGRAAFDSFKARSEEIAAELNHGLGSVNHGQSVMDTSFRTGDDTMASNATSTMGSANFDAARFRG